MIFKKKMSSSVYRILYIKQNPQIYSLTEQFVFSFTLAPIDMGVFFFHEFCQLNSLAFCLKIITTEKTNVLYIIVLTYLYRLVIVEEDIISIFSVSHPHPKFIPIDNINFAFYLTSTK